MSTDEPAIAVNGVRAMDKGRALTVTEVGERTRLGTSAYEGVTEPNHKCQEPRPLQPGDRVTVLNVAPTSVLVTGPCGCDYLLWGLVPEASACPMDNGRDERAVWDDLLGKIGVYMELLFVLNGRRDKEVWQYIVGVAAHLEYLAVFILWVDAGKPGRFEDYEDRLALGAAINKIGGKGLLDAVIIDAARAITQLRNSVAHRGAVWGVTVVGEAQRGVYKGRHLFTDPEALRQLMLDADGTIEAMGDWLRQRGAL